MSDTGDRQLPFGSDDLRLPGALRGRCAPTSPRSVSDTASAAGAVRWGSDGAQP